MISVKNSRTSPSRDVILFLSENAEAFALWEYIFAQQDCFVLWKTSAQAMLDLLPVFSPALVILDLPLWPDDQLLLCRRTRRSFYGPIMILLQQDDPQQVIDLYEAGADECLIQPEGAIYLPVKALAWMRRYQWLEPDLRHLRGLM